LSVEDRNKIVCTVDRARALVYWHFPTVNGGGSLDGCVIYNIKTGQWGKWAVTIQAAVQYSCGQITYDTLGDSYTSYDALPSISFDYPFWLADQTIPGVFIGNSVMSLTGEPGESALVTGDFGDMTDFTYLSRVTPRYTRSPTSATAKNFYRNELGDTPTGDSTVGLSRGRFDFRRSARWHRIRMTQTGAMTVNGLDVAIAGDSAE